MLHAPRVNDSCLWVSVFPHPLYIILRILCLRCGIPGSETHYISILSKLILAMVTLYVEGKRGTWITIISYDHVHNKFPESRKNNLRLWDIIIFVLMKIQLDLWVSSWDHPSSIVHYIGNFVPQMWYSKVKGFYILL